MTADADLFRTAFTTLVTSAAPAEPSRAARAALAAASRATALPPEFGSDTARDAAWLAQQLDGVSPPWPVIHAMAWAAGIPHTALVPPELRAAMMAMRTGTPPMEPGFLMHTLADGRIVVSDVAAGCSADASGLRVGDVITSLDGEPVERPLARLMRMFRHPAGTELPVTLIRRGETLDLTLRLAPGLLTLVDSKMLSDAIGWVFVRAVTASDDPARDVGALVRKAVAGMLGQGMRGLVLDLRSNPGGNGEGSSRAASALSAGAPMLAFRSRDGKESEMPRFGEPLALGDAKIVVLVDDQSASAAEMLALALREHAHARLVGVETAGALTAPEMTPLRDGFMLMTPGGRSLGPVSRKVFDGDRLAVDVRIPNRTPDDFAAGRDAQLDAARELLQA